MPSGRTIAHVLCSAVCSAVTASLAFGAAPLASASEPAPAAGSVGPLLASFAASPRAVDVSAASAAVAVTVRLADPDGVASAAIRLGDNGVTPLALASGTATDGTWAGVVDVPAFTEHGTIPAVVETADAVGATAAPEVAAAVDVVDTAPAVPSAIAARTDSTGAIRVVWSAPAGNGGSDVTAYDVIAAPAPGSSAEAVEPPAIAVDGAARSATFLNLSDTTRYVVRVTARNAVGAGPSAFADATTAVGDVTVADAPTALAVAPENGALRLAWTPPVSDGGSFVSGYEVRATPWTAAASTPVALTVAADAREAVVPGLVNGMPYDVSVTAVNASGTSLAAVAAATPRTTPGVPALGAVTAGDTTAVVRWTPPASDGGSAITSYAVAVSHGYTVSVPATERSVTIAALPNGVPVSFTVAAVNAAGPGPASAPSPAVVPRQSGRMVVVAPPAGAVAHGTAVSVGVALLAVGDVGIPGQRVELLAQIRPSTSWTRVAYGITNANGRVTLSVALPATATLRLHHPLTVVGAPDVTVRTVTVAPRLTAVASNVRIRLGQSLTVRGAVAPAHPTGTVVYLQRFYSGMWRNVAQGRFTTSTAYAVGWKPPSAGGYLLRVVLPAHNDHALGTSPQWRQTVETETAAQVAKNILALARITLETTHDSGIRDAATPRQNVYDLSLGRYARRSAYQNAPGGSTPVDIRLLRALRRMGQAGSVTVSEIAGGSHSRGSLHYSGRGLDISWVNGRHVARFSGYQMAVDACRANGAVRIFHPGYDPYGGHQNHVHCEW